MPNWTDAQLDAIKARRGTVLVSAAAGSGKTAVLVERVIERLTDPEHPTDADRLLVVTFTKAAAAEMRDRIEKRLLALMKEQPENTRLRRQQLLLQQAHICTVDSFCSDIVREFFYCGKRPKALSLGSAAFEKAGETLFARLSFAYHRMEVY